MNRMTLFMNTVSIIALLYTLVSATRCDSNGASCQSSPEEPDLTSLMQVKQSVNLGSDRLGKELERVVSRDVAFGEDLEDEDLVRGDALGKDLGEEDLLEVEESADEHGSPAEPKLPAGCEDRGCKGGRGFCSGNSDDCSSKGWDTLGYYSRCAGESVFASCITGYKVRCASCSPRAPPVPAPAAKTIPKPWKAPKAPAPAPAPPPPAMPKRQPLSNKVPASMSLPVYNPDAVTDTTKQVKDAITKVGELRTKLKEVSEKEAGYLVNISVQETNETESLKMMEDARAAAVRFAKKRALANQTLVKTMKALDDAISGEQGATVKALLARAAAKTAKKKKIYYKKKFVSQQEKEKDAAAKLAVGRVAVSKAYADQAVAKQADAFYHSMEHSKQNQKMFTASVGQKNAASLDVKSAMEKAYIATSPGRKESNIPSYGR